MKLWAALACWLSLGASLTLGAESFHPPFVALDDRGQLVRDSGRPISTALSCMACHDTAFIGAHNLHGARGANVDCLSCHSPTQSLPTHRAAFDAQGRLGAAHITLQAPADEQCLSCHGAGGGPHPLGLPPRYLDPSPASGRHPQHMSREQGTLYSGEPKKVSRLNLQGKAALDAPWDVHAARLVSCVDCHYSPNKPSRMDRVAAGPQHLKRDPRSPSTGAYLRRPDHQLASADCLHCHDPSQSHAFLPYAKRHFEMLDCRACHVPVLHAPVLKQEDRARLDAQGRPAQEWHNLDGSPDDPLNTRLIRPFQPWLAPLAQRDGKSRVRPVNVLTERAWHDASGHELDFELVRKAHQGLKHPADLDALRTRLLALGANAPHVSTSTRLVPIGHGVQEGEAVLRSCLDCHRSGARLDRPYSFGSLADPGDPKLPKPDDSAHLYLPGLDRQTLSTRLGFSFFLLTVLGVAGHGYWRWRTQRQRRHLGHRESQRVYLYSAYERFWHWTMAASTLGLVLTGLEIHFNAGIQLLGFALAVKMHNVLALALLANAALSLFHHLSTGAIGQFIPRDKDLPRALLAQARYYLKGIFVGAAHPVPKTAGRKLNPLQQLTYLALLNILLPFQIITGVLIWGAGRWPELSAAIGGLAIVTPLHNLGSWLFMSFTLGHVYLTTTGHTPTSNLKAMLDGWDEIDTTPPQTVEPDEEDYRGAD